MDFGLTTEQQIVVDTVRGFVEKELYPHEEEVEPTGGIPPGLGEAIKRKLIDLGFYARNLPMEGAGGDPDNVTFALLERELGRTSMTLSLRMAEIPDDDGRNRDVRLPIKVCVWVEGSTKVVCFCAIRSLLLDAETSEIEVPSNQGSFCPHQRHCTQRLHLQPQLPGCGGARTCPGLSDRPGTNGTARSRAAT